MIFLLIIPIADMNQPTMEKWTEAWHNSDGPTLKDLYAPNASVFPPKRPTLVGNEKILDHFKGGFGKVDVYFHPEFLEIDGHIAYEFGEFRDVKWGTDELTEKGKYAITWIKLDGTWKILCHTFSIGDND